MSRILIQIMLFIFPWKIRRSLLCKIFGFQIDKTAKIGLSIILARELILEENSNIGSLVICKGIDCFKSIKALMSGILCILQAFQR